MWKFIMIAMFYSPSGQMLQEFPTPMSVNTEATCREMMNRYTQSKKNVVKNGKKYQLEVKTDCVFDPEPTTKTASAPDAAAISQSPGSTAPAGPHASAPPAAGTSDAPRVIPLYKTSPEANPPVASKAPETTKPADHASAGQSPARDATAPTVITSPTPARDPRSDEQRIDVAKPAPQPEPVEQAKPVTPPALPQTAKRSEQATREPVRPVEQAPPAPPLAKERNATDSTPAVVPSPSPSSAPIQRAEAEPKALPAPRPASRELSSKTGRSIPGDLPREQWHERASRDEPEDDKRQRRTTYEEHRFAARRGGLGSDFPVGGFFSDPPPRAPYYRSHVERDYEDDDFIEQRSYRRRDSW